MSRRCVFPVALSVILLTSSSSVCAQSPVLNEPNQLKCLECISIEYGDLYRFDTCHQLRQQQQQVMNTDNDRPIKTDTTTNLCAACVRENLTITFSDTTKAFPTISPVSHIIVTSLHCLKSLPSASRRLTQSNNYHENPVIRVDKKVPEKQKQQSCITPDIRRYVRVKLKVMRLQQQQQQQASSLNKQLQQLNQLWMHTYENLDRMLTDYGEHALAHVAADVKASICRCSNGHWCNDKIEERKNLLRNGEEEEDLNAIKSAEQLKKSSSSDGFPEEASNSASDNTRRIMKLIKTTTSNLL